MGRSFGRVTIVDVAVTSDPWKRIGSPKHLDLLSLGVYLEELIGSSLCEHWASFRWLSTAACSASISTNPEEVQGVIAVPIVLSCFKSKAAVSPPMVSEG